MKRSRRVAVSSALTTGLVGLAALAVAAVPGSAALASAGADSSQIRDDQSAEQRQALQEALDSMAARTDSLSADLTKAQRQLQAARKAAAKAEHDGHDDGGDGGEIDG
jgi:hypothetical protein